MLKKKKNRCHILLSWLPPVNLLHIRKMDRNSAFRARHMQRFALKICSFIYNWVLEKNNNNWSLSNHNNTTTVQDHSVFQSSAKSFSKAIVLIVFKFVENSVDSKYIFISSLKNLKLKKRGLISMTFFHISENQKLHFHK